MNKVLLKCFNCKTVMGLWGPHEIPENFTDICPCCGSKMTNLNSDEYRYGQLA